MRAIARQVPSVHDWPAVPRVLLHGVPCLPGEIRGQMEKESKSPTLHQSRREIHRLVLGTPWLLPLDFSLYAHRKLEPPSNLRVSSIGLGPDMGAWC